MEAQFGDDFQPLTNALIDQLGEGEKIYAVGGVVRDMLMKHAIRDFDLALDGDVKKYGKRVADALDAAFFMLNDEFPTARVVNRSKKNSWKHIDIAQMRGLSIEDDLILRDVTINAIAIDLQNPNRLIDPLSGAQHLMQKNLVACSELAYCNDPVRILRTLRQSISYGWRIMPDTLKLMKQSIPTLLDVSAERLRDELMRILDVKDPSVSLNLMDRLGILTLFFPEVLQLKSLRLAQADYESSASQWEALLLTLQKAVMLEQLLVREYPEEGSGDLRGGQAVLQLGRFRRELQEYYAVRLHPERNLRSLSFLALFFERLAATHQLGIDAAPNPLRIAHDFERRAREWVLTNHEIKFGRKLIDNRNVIHALAAEKETPSGSDVYRFFRGTEKSGISLCLLSLAETLADYHILFPEEQYRRELQVCRSLMTGYFHKTAEWVNPPQWINGHDLAKILAPQDHVRTGYWLEQVKCASAEGSISSRQEALQFVRQNYRPTHPR